MAYTQPVLNSVTLPHVSGYTERVLYLGSRTRLANGTLRTHLVNTSAKRLFVLEWRGLTDTNCTTLRTAFDTALKASTSFTSPNGGSFTVVVDESQMDMTFEAVRQGVGTTLRWSTTLILREV